MVKRFTYALIILVLSVGCTTGEEKKDQDNSGDVLLEDIPSSETSSQKRDQGLSTPEPEASNSSGTIVSTLPMNEKGEVDELSLDDVVRVVLDHNNTVRLQQYEIIKSDTELKKEESKYTTRLYAAYEGYVKKDNTKFSSPIMGNVTTSDALKAGVSRLFSTGTMVQLEVSDSRYDTNAGEGSFAMLSGGSFLSLIKQPPVHTGALSVTLSQELLKNSFGYSQERINQIARNNTSIQRENLTYQLSNLVVKAMIDYWSLAIEEENLETQKLLFDNLKSITGITRRKTAIGLAEPFEVNQWNALLAQSESALKQAEVSRNNKRRELLRTMNLDPDIKLSGATKLATDIPEGMNLEKDIEMAYSTRPDFRSIKLQKENVKMSSEIAENNLLPSMTLSGKYSSRDQGLHGNTAYNAVPRGTYPESSIQFRVEYPLWDEGAHVDSRNAKINLKQLSIQEEELKRKIHDELAQGYETIKVSHDSLNNAKYAMEQTQVFYNRLLTRYRQGRFTAEAVKNALDALFQARLGYMRAQISFNIALVQYDMTRNNIWNRFNVDIESVIDRMAKSELE